MQSRVYNYALLPQWTLLEMQNKVLLGQDTMSGHVSVPEVSSVGHMTLPHMIEM